MRNTLLKTLPLLLLPFIAQATPLDVLTAKAQAVAQTGARPVVIFDLDDTLFDTRARTQQILQEFAVRNETMERYPDAVAPLASVARAEIHFALSETLAALGLHQPGLHTELQAFWSERFFSNQYLRRDRLIRGAQRLTRALTDLRIRVVYLTGRDRPRMGTGTLAQLKRFALPLGTLGVLFMKPVLTQSDRDFKAEALESIPQLGTVIGGFENEPTNANLIQQAFPSAQVYLLESIESGRPVQVHPQIERIRSL